MNAPLCSLVCCHLCLPAVWLLSRSFTASSKGSFTEDDLPAAADHDTMTAAGLKQNSQVSQVKSAL